MVAIKELINIKPGDLVTLTDGDNYISGYCGSSWFMVLKILSSDNAGIIIKILIPSGVIVFSLFYKCCNLIKKIS